MAASKKVPGNGHVAATSTATVTSKKTDETISSMPLSWTDVFVTKATYQHVAAEFHPFHRHDLNVFLHVFTTGLGVWGAMQLAVVYDATVAVYAYAVLIALTTPAVTAVVHTLYVAACLHVVTLPASVSLLTGSTNLTLTEPWQICVAAIVAGYGLQDLAHWLCCEKTYMGSYMFTRPYMLLIHSVWLMPLVIDAASMRSWFLPALLFPRNRNVVTSVANKQAVDALRAWIAKNVPSTPETTHLWPHKQDGTDGPVTALENDAAILAGFRKVFAPQHYSVKSVVPMNEIYVTAVGSKKEINSDAVFYTPHTDGPYWWLPGCSLYRVLVGVTQNQMVRTRFNLQHESNDTVVDLYDVLGFDYNRELHWIDHVPGTSNSERRSLIKLHYIVYPAGWERYGQFAATLNTNYNTWARNNFLRTLRPSSLYEYVLAWWIWLCTWTNSFQEMCLGWNNIAYMAATYLLLDSSSFMIATSFRHYAMYIVTFANRQMPLAHGLLMRDAKLYKTVSMMHLAHRLLPLVQLPHDVPGLFVASLGFITTLLATARLGMVRTYFGAEFGLVKPCWIHGFPYGVIPHPMILGQVFAYAVILAWFWPRLSTDQVYLLTAHSVAYLVHMTQEILTSSY